MALNKYNASPPPLSGSLVNWTYNEFRNIDRVTSGILLTLALLDGKQIQIGPVDSAGVGFRALRIPN